MSLSLSVSLSLSLSPPICEYPYLFVFVCVFFWLCVHTYRGILTDIQNNIPATGILKIQVEILAVTGLSFDDPENDPEVTPKG